MDTSFLDELDEEQKVAVVEPEGKIVVIAGPGSGKTRVITYKIAYLLMTGVRASEMLLVTFTRAAARQMIERAQKATRAELNDMLAGTFHHVCNILLRKYGSAVGLKPNFTIWMRVMQRFDEDCTRTICYIQTDEQGTAYKHRASQLVFLHGEYILHPLRSCIERAKEMD